MMLNCRNRDVGNTVHRQECLCYSDGRSRFAAVARVGDSATGREGWL